MDKAHDEIIKTIHDYCRGWAQRDWDGMLPFVQKHFIATLGKKGAAKYLAGNFYKFLPGTEQTITVEEVERGLNRDVARDYIVSLELHGQAPPILRTKLMFRLIKEGRIDGNPFYIRWWRKLAAKIARKRYTPLPDPDIDGTWGVNPVSVLRGKIK